MGAPLIDSIAGFSLAVPLVVAVWRGAWRGARGWVVAWAAVLAMEEALQVALSAAHVHNIWVGYVFEPVAMVLALWALSLWQAGRVAKLALRLAIPAALGVFAVLTLAFDNTSTFSRAAQPMLALVGLGAAAYTLVARSAAGSGDLLGKGWFWICGGMTLYFGTFATVGPVSGLLLRDPLLFRRAYELAMGLMLVAFLAISRGIACPPEA